MQRRTNERRVDKDGDRQTRRESEGLATSEEPVLEDEVRDDERLAAEELAGESEHSLRVAEWDERGTSRRRKLGVPAEDITVDPDEGSMARHYLSTATEAPASPGSSWEEPVRLPGDEDESLEGLSLEALEDVLLEDDELEE